MITAFAPVTDTLNTKQKIEHTFECTAGHITTGTALLRNGRGYTCRFIWCGKPVTDISNTKEGRDYFAIVRPDLSHKKVSQS